ncbi:MAG: phage tail protein [Acidimicrobiales bacterium]
MVATPGRAAELAQMSVAFSGRGIVEGLPSARMIGPGLPALFQEDDFCRRFTAALDGVLAPIFATLDCWDSYLDPHLAPDDFVDWLASWVGVDIDETWTLERRRELVERVVALYRVRGTAAGLAAHVALYAGATPEIVESGGCDWSAAADTPLPGSPQPHLLVRLQVADPSAVNRTTVERIASASRPAHLPVVVEIGTSFSDVADATPGGAADRGLDEGTGDGAPGAIDLPGSEHVELAPPGPVSEEELEEGPEPTAPDEEEHGS